jgi:hypothetical protein
VGVGVTPSAWQSTFKAVEVGFGGSISGRTNSNQMYIGTNNYVNASSNYAYKNSDYATNYAQYNGAHMWSTATIGTAGNAITFTQAMTLDASGKLNLSGNTGTRVAEFSQGTNTSGYNCIYAGLLSNGGNTSSYFLHGNTNAVGNWYLYGNGTTSFTSDARLKKNIATARDGYLDDLCKLRVVKYNWNKDTDDTPKELGLIAQEVQEVFAGLVQDDIEKISEDDDTTYLSLKQSVIPFILLKAIQELNAKFEEYKASHP